MVDPGPSETWFRLLVEQIPAIVYEMDGHERRTLYVSPHVEEILGYPREEWLDQPDIWTELLHVEDREIELAAHDRYTETGEPWSREYRLIAEDGRIVWVRDHARLISDTSGRERWQGVMLDISPQKQAEEALRAANDELEMGVLSRSAQLTEANEMMALEIGERRRMEAELREAEARYRLLVEHLPAAVYSWEVNADEDDRGPGDPQPYMSPQIERIVGFTAAQFGSNDFWRTRVHPHDRDRVLALADRVGRTGEPFSAEYRYLAKDGSVVWVLDRATLRRRDARGLPQTFQGVIVDITTRKEAEERATEAEARYRRLTEQGPAMAYAFRLDHETDPPAGTVEYLSPRLTEVMGEPPPDESLERLRDLVHPDDRDTVDRMMRNLRSAGEPWTETYRAIAADGSIVWLHDQGLVVARDPQGRPVRFQGMLLDVTAERERLQTLEASEGTLREIVEGSPAVSWVQVVDADTGHSRSAYLSPQVEALLGYRAADLMEEPGFFGRIVHPDDAERVRAGYELAGQTRSPWEDEFRVVAHDGSVRTVHAAAHPGPLDPEARTVTWSGVAVDVTTARGALDASATARTERPG